MLKILCTVTLLVAVMFNSNAQFTVTGAVMDEKGRPLSGATVQLVQTVRLSITDEFGKFRLENLTEGEHNILIKYLGYEDDLFLLDVHENISLERQLKVSSVITDEVIVEATRASEGTPTAYVDINRQEIQKKNFGQDLPYLLNWTPSLVTTSDAGTGVGYTGLRIRGSDATRINVTINGIPYNDSESLGTFWVDIPDIASSSQSIQIQRGVGTSTNGAGAFGGTVNLQTNSLRDESYAQLISSVGSFNTQRYTLAAGTGLLNDHWTIDGRISRIKSDGYIERASSDLDSYYLTAGYYGKKTIWKAIVFGGREVTYQSWYGIDPDMMKINRRFNYAGAIYDENWNVARYYDSQVDDYRQDHSQLHFSHRFSDILTINASLHYTYGRGFYEEYNQGLAFADLGLPDVIIGDSTITNSDVVTRKWLNNHFYGSTFSINYNPTSRVGIVLGGGYHHYAPAKHYGEIIWAQEASNSRLGMKYYEGESQKIDASLYTKLTYQLTEKINTFIDLQFRKVDYETDGIDDYQTPYEVNDRFNFFNPKAGLSFQMSDQNQLYASYAIAHREPTRSDYLDGDIKPRAERLGNLELGFRKSASNYQLEINYYLMNYKDQLVFTGELNNVGSPIRSNVGKSYRTGLEVSGLVRFSSKFSWNANFTWSANKNIKFVWFDDASQQLKKDTNIILSPNLIGSSQLSYEPLTSLQLSLLSKYVGKQFLDNTSNDDLALAAYFINDFRLSYELFPKGTKGITISVMVNNLLDVEYASNGYSYDGVPYVYPQAGRNFLFMVNLRL